MPKKIGARTVVVIREPKRSKLDPEPATAPPEHDITGCVVMPRTSHEEEKGWVIVDGRMVIAPFDADILATDKVRVDGTVWEVDGEPGDYEDRKARGKATIFYLKRLGTS